MRLDVNNLNKVLNKPEPLVLEKDGERFEIFIEPLGLDYYYQFFEVTNIVFSQSNPFATLDKETSEKLRVLIVASLKNAIPNEEGNVFYEAQVNRLAQDYWFELMEKVIDVNMVSFKRKMSPVIQKILDAEAEKVKEKDDEPVQA